MEVSKIDTAKLAEENPNSRFKVLDTAVMPPGVCALCGSAGGDKRQFIDFGKTLDWYGAVYFCTFCFAELAKLMGFATYANHDELFKKYEKLLLQVGTEKLETEFVQRKLDAAMVLVRGCTCSDSGIGVPVVEVVDGEFVGDGETDSTESDADESVDVEGPNDVSAASSDSDDKPVRRARKSS